MRYFLIIAILFWWFFGAYLWTCHVKNQCWGNEVEVVEETIPQNPLVINGEGFSQRSDQNLRFDLNGVTPEIPSLADNSLNELASFLNRNENKQVTVTGLYASADAKPAGFANLGLGRATQVKNVLLKKGVKAGQIVTKANVENNLPVYKNKVIGGVDFSLSSKAVAQKPAPVAKPAAVTKPAKPAFREPALAIAGGGLNLRSAQNLRFPVNGSKPEIPKQVDANLVKLGQFLKKNANKQVTVTGLYNAKDKKPARFVNLGLARADEVKKALIRKGINTNQIVTKAQVRNNLVVNVNKVYGAANLVVGNKGGLSDKALDFSKATADSFKKGQRIEMKNVKFATGSANLTNTSFVDLNKLVTILNENKTVKIEVGGHTDNTGKLASNNKLSQQRAQSVVTYLVGKGIVKNRLVPKGYGPAQPVANNKTPQGRQQNRRVEITVN